MWSFSLALPMTSLARRPVKRQLANFETSGRCYSPQRLAAHHEFANLTLDI
jgi:hypothetical protein